MKKSALFTALALTTALTSTPLLADEQRAGEARAAIQEFAKSLQGELGAAMKAGGPTQAIEVCNTRAPEIAADMSKQKGMNIARTSLKTRNAKNKPDAWEQKVLESFEQRKAAGEDVAKIDHFEVVTNDGKQEFRYMKAIPTGEVCLKCHGTEIDPAVIGKLDGLYPQDTARGFKQGDIRGAFTIRQSM
ncbi:MAG: DUF3365 domain-containing protein [Chromatiales bacterium]|nr:DUF3365 domain-containing protein [Chromatiales bacterium]